MNIFFSIFRKTPKNDILSTEPHDTTSDVPIISPASLNVTLPTFCPSATGAHTFSGKSKNASTLDNSERFTTAEKGSARIVKKSRFPKRTGVFSSSSASYLYSA